MGLLSNLSHMTQGFPPYPPAAAPKGPDLLGGGSPLRGSVFFLLKEVPLKNAVKLME